jgi:hypothetical protein
MAEGERRRERLDVSRPDRPAKISSDIQRDGYAPEAYLPGLVAERIVEALHPPPPPASEKFFQ